MMTEKKFRIPGEDQELRQPPVHWQLKYDTTHDVIRVDEEPGSSRSTAQDSPRLDEGVGTKDSSL